MNNDNTSRGWVIDLVGSIANDLALSNHLIENIINQKNLLINGGEADSEKLDRYISLEKTVTSIRRSKMRLLIQDVEFDKELWCPLKHAIESFMQSSEVYQATGSEESLVMMTESNNVLAGIISLSLGMELEPCMRCVSDKLS